MSGEDDTIDGVPVAELVALLSVPPEQFVARRTARAKELRAEGHRADAAALAKVHKPLRLVWAVGEVARRQPELATEAAVAAEEAEEAMAGRGDVRAVLARFRDVVGRAAEVGGALDPSVDRSAAELALREVLADPTARSAWARGCLLGLPSETPMPADELAPRRAKRRAEAKERAAVAPAVPAEPGRSEAAQREAAAQAEAEAEAAAAAAEEAARQARARALARERAHTVLDQATAEAHAAQVAHDEALSAVRDADERLAEVRAAVEHARQVADGAAARLAAAAAAAEEAEAALRSLDPD